jgi:hypothetical protein
MSLGQFAIGMVVLLGVPCGAGYLFGIGHAAFGTALLAVCACCAVAAWCTRRQQ